jgi:hypothetical protein
LSIRRTRSVANDDVDRTDLLRGDRCRQKAAGREACQRPTPTTRRSGRRDLKEEQDQAEALQAKVEQAEARADRFDLAEALLEIGLVITSVTLLTRSRIYWYLGLGFSLLGRGDRWRRPSFSSSDCRSPKNPC